MFTQTQQRRQRNAFFQFSSFVSIADFNVKHVQFLIKLSQFLQQRYRNRVSHSVSASLLLTLGRLLLAQLQISSYKSTVFYESIIFQFRYYTCSLCLFLSFESNSLPVIVVKERYIKESLGQSQDFGNLVLAKVKSNLRISVYLSCFYCQEFIL